MSICEKKPLLFLGGIWAVMIAVKLMTSSMSVPDILVSGVIALSNVVLVYILAKRMFPQNEDIPKLASVIFMGCPPFFMYMGEAVSGFLPSSCILLSVLLIINTARTGLYRYVLCFCIGATITYIAYNVWDIPLIEEGKPLWFYALMLLFSFWPLLLWPHVWRSIIAGYKPKKVEGYGLLGVWSVLSVGAVFINGGQGASDIIPVLPIVSIYLASLLSSHAAEDNDMLMPFWAGILLFMLIGVSSAFNNLFVTILLGAFMLSALMLRAFFENKTLAHVSLFLVMNSLFVLLLS